MGADYVNRLYDMVIRNFPGGIEFKFVCFTDDPTGLNEGIIAKPLPEGLNGWWNKLYLFSPDAFDKGDRVLFLDLDTVIVSKLDDIITYAGDFAILRDFYRPEGLGSAIMAWEAGKVDFIWNDWLLSGKPDVAGGDQIWIEKVFEFTDYKPDILQRIFPDNIVSYKVHAQHGIPKGARIVAFHGHPRPHEVTGNWVERVWKIGGETSFETNSIPNVDTSIWIQNIENNSKLDYPWITGESVESGHAVIIGGAPSINSLAGEIIWRRDQGQKIIALNGSAKWLEERGVIPDYHVILDARPENAEFITGNAKHYLLASLCDAECFKRAGSNITLWHPLLDGIHNFLPDDKPYALIGGGSTVGLKAMALACVMGFDEIHVYGMDSSYSGKEGHAYPQPLNDGERIIEVTVDDQKFSAAPWMVTQASEFQELAVNIINAGKTLTIHGEGLLPYMAKKLYRQAEVIDDLMVVNGDYWPVGDTGGRWNAENAINDLQYIYGYCDRFGVAVQAGGNAGIWPRELAKKFERVYTFEPDPVNFRCLNLNAKAENIIKFQAALGNERGLIGLERVNDNCGANHVKAGGIIPTLRVDDLGLDACDLLYLDIEGFEINALEGAAETIAKYSPVVVAEENGLTARYGYEAGSIAKWLYERGYKQVSAIHRDLIFIKQL